MVVRLVLLVVPANQIATSKPWNAGVFSTNVHKTTQVVRYTVFGQVPSRNLVCFSANPETAARKAGWNSGPICHRKIMIAEELKWEIRDKLDQANIKERVLFPGLNGWLRRKYMQPAGQSLNEPGRSLFSNVT